MHLERKLLTSTRGLTVWTDGEHSHQAVSVYCRSQVVVEMIHSDQILFIYLVWWYNCFWWVIPFLYIRKLGFVNLCICCFIYTGWSVHLVHVFNTPTVLYVILNIILLSDWPDTLLQIPLQIMYGKNQADSVNEKGTLP